MTHNFTHTLPRRYTTKKNDNTKKVTPQDLEYFNKAVQLFTT
ncbi:MAG: hypothetical protein ACI849_000221 [Patiriisocius sp.]|jgi:hypothetical protein